MRLMHKERIMLNQNIKAEKLFSLYRYRVERSLAFYNRLKLNTPGLSYPTFARRIWREGMLAEIWGLMATHLNQNGVNYLENWREGK